MAKQTREQNRRYYLHQRIKNIVRYDARSKILYISYEADLNKDMQELQREFNYQVQLEIN